jgi:VanZ family protein
MNQAQPTPIASRFIGAGKFLLLFGLLFVLIYYFNGITESDLFSISLKDSGHTAVFFVATLLLAKILSTSLFSDRLGQGLVIPTTFFGAIITGILIELIQPWLGRHGTFLDVWYDLLGCTAGILIFVARHRIRARKKQILAIGGACILLSISSILPVYFYQVMALRNEAFPIMFNAEANWQSELVRASHGAYINIVDAPTNWKNNDTKVIRLDMSHGQYPGINFHQLPMNWSRYQALRIDVFSKLKANTNLVIRIDDTKHNQEHNDRFNQTLLVKPGLNQFEIPLADIKNAPQDRQLALDAIHNLILFSTEAKADLTVYLDNIRLK